MVAAPLAATGRPCYKHQVCLLCWERYTELEHMFRKVHVSEHSLMNSRDPPCSHMQKEKQNIAGAPEAPWGPHPVTSPKCDHDADFSLRGLLACF